MCWKYRETFSVIFYSIVGIVPMAKTKYLTRKQLSTRIDKLIEDEDPNMPMSIILQLEEKILDRAERIAKKLNVSATTKTYLSQQDYGLMVSEIKRSYQFAQIDPGSAVGMVAAQSIGEPGTQMSLPGTETVIIRIKDQTDILPIGDFIEDLIGSLVDQSTLSDPYDNLVVDIPEELEIYVPGLGTDEKIRWQRLLQVSRHPPNGELLRISTRSGRSITGTFSHSFLVRKNNNITPIKGSELKLGDRMPSVQTISAEDVKQYLEIQDYLEKDEIWYGSELAIAISVGEHWREEYDLSYTVPVKKEALWKMMKSQTGNILKPGFVYSKMYDSSHTRIPEKLKLDEIFGFFIGAYLAQGSLAFHFVSVTNSDFLYRQKVIDFADKLGINYDVKEEIGEFGESISIFLHSSLLSTLISRMCGKGSNNKFVPTWALNATDEFVSSLLQAYFDGDGSVSSTRNIIKASSNSKQLIDGICLLLSRFGIFTTKSHNDQFKLVIPGRYASIFEEKIGFVITRKKQVLSKLAQLERKIHSENAVTYDLLDMIPGFGDSFDKLQVKLKFPFRFATKLTKKQQVERSSLKKYIEEFKLKSIELNVDISQELAPLERAVESQVIWDEIMKLESVPSPSDFVYDFTVSELETFITGEGLVTHNTLRTFHFAGVREMNVTLGLPRLIEIVDARRNPSTPTMTVALEDKYAFKPE